ncbi:hypothetical protein J3R83DRAFT_8157 [Lanmaoa asiatica]|nr:hypothetical protein J3R83DRAFT_8157 [Lanmaoa asiatica]
MSRWLFVLLAFLYFVWLTTRSHSPPSDALDLAQAPFVEDHSLTVVLPLISSTLGSLDQLLAPFLVSTRILYEVAIVCPHSLVADIHRKLRIVLSNAPLGHPKVSLYPCKFFSSMNTVSSKLPNATEHIWSTRVHCICLLDPADSRDRLIIGLSSRPPIVHDQQQFLVPPFVAPSSLLARAPLTFPASSVWSALGNYIAKSTLGSFGGIVIGADIMDTMTCNARAEFDITFSDEESDDNPDPRTLADLGSVPYIP